MPKRKLPFILLLYLVPLTILICWTWLVPSLGIRDQLVKIIPWSLEINFALLCAAVYLTRGTWLAVITEIPRRMRIMAAACAVLAFVMAAVVAPRTHRIYYDEDIYLNIAQNIASLKKDAMCLEGRFFDGEYRCPRLEYNKDPSAWPYLISLPYRAFGVGEGPAFWLNNALFPLAVLCIFLIGHLLSDDDRVGLYASVLYALIPINALWFSTAAAEPSATTSCALAVLAVLMFLKKPSHATLLLLATTLPFAAQFRSESILIYPVVLAAWLLWKPKKTGVMESLGTHALLALSLALLLPHLAHLYSVRMEDWGSSGAKISLSYLRHNLHTNALFYLLNSRFPACVTILIGCNILNLRNWRERSLLGTWFLLFSGIFVVFYAGSYERDANVRFSMLSYAPLSLLAGWGAYCLEQRLSALPSHALQTFSKACLCLVVIFQLMGFLPFMRVVGDEGWAARFDHQYAQEMAQALPPDSIILSHNPNMFLVWGKSAMQASSAQDHPFMDQYFHDLNLRGGVYFHYNAWCTYDDPVQKKICTDLLDGYRSILLENYPGRGEFKYQLYLLMPESAGAPNPQ